MRISQPYATAGIVGSMRRKEPVVDLDALEIGRRYRVDHRHERLRRTFRTEGTLVAIEEMAPDEEHDEPGHLLVVEVKPRFGPAAEQPIEVETVTAIDAL
jgi:hypothetical protein